MFREKQKTVYLDVLAREHTTEGAARVATMKHFVGLLQSMSDRANTIYGSNDLIGDQLAVFVGSKDWALLKTLIADIEEESNRRKGPHR